MSADHYTLQSSSTLLKADFSVPDGIIEDFLGLGLAYSEWPAEVQKRGHAWYPGLEKIIIEKEWEFFKPEIQRLRLEPKIAQSSRSKSNSLASILKRLKGEPWLEIEGRSDEREERRRTHRLLGKDAKIRCLQKYVHDWDEESASSATARPAAESSPSQPTVQDHPTRQIGSLSSPPEMRHFNDTPGPEARHTSGNVPINTDELHSIYDYPSQFGSPLSHIPTQPKPFSLTTGDFDLLPAFQNAVPLPDVDISGSYLESGLPETCLKSPPAFSHDVTMASFDHFAISEDGVPTSTDYNQPFGLPEQGPNVFEWMEANPVSENFEPAEAEMLGSDPAFQRNSFGLDGYLVFEDTEAFEAGSTTEGMSVDLAGQHNSQTGYLEVVSQPISSPELSSKGRKRRRQNSSGVSLEIPDYGNATTPATNYVESDRDTMMSGYENDSQHTNKLVSQGPLKQLIRPSGPSPTPQCACMPSNHGYTQIRTQIELEQEVKRGKEMLNSVRKRHQKEVESFVRRQKAAEDEILELQKKIQEIQKSTEDYAAMTCKLLSDNVILQEANSRKKHVSGLSPTGTKEREHNAKLIQSLPPSKNPRPLSLTLRPATANKDSSSPPPKPSASSSHDMSILRLPIATPSSSRPDSADSSWTSSGQSVSGVSPSKATGLNNQSGSADGIASPNPNTSIKRDPSPFQHLMHKLSPFLRKQCRDDSNKAVQTVPVLPPLEASVPLDRQMAGVLLDGDKRLTNDSGYDSLQFETRSRGSMMNAENNKYD